MINYESLEWPCTTNSSLVGEVIGCPPNVSSLAKAPEDAGSRKSLNITIWYNQDWDHIFIEREIASDYYDEYVMTTSYSASIDQLQIKQIQRIKALSPNSRSVLEVGCGDGFFLEKAAGEFNQHLGVEPSIAFYEQALSRGVNVVNDYLKDGMDLQGAPFDAFVSRQVFEHLENPIKVLRSTLAYLDAEAVGLIEVPNGKKSIEFSRFYDFFPDHLQYYSAQSLTMMAKACGLTVLSCDQSFGGDYLELWVKNVPCTLAHMQGRIHGVSSLIQESIHAVESALTRESESDVFFWGSGAKGLSILNRMEGEAITRASGLIDSDPNKQGKYVPGTAIQIVDPSVLKTCRTPTVIIFALSYIEEITRQAKDINPCCKVYSLRDLMGLDD